MGIMIAPIIDPLAELIEQERQRKLKEQAQLRDEAKALADEIAAEISKIDGIAGGLTSSYYGLGCDLLANTLFEASGKLNDVCADLRNV